MTIAQAIKKIDQNRVYSLTELVRAGLIPPVKSYPTAYRIVLEDLAKAPTARVLNAQIIGEGRGRTIRIRGADLVDYLTIKRNVK